MLSRCGGAQQVVLALAIVMWSCSLASGQTGESAGDSAATPQSGFYPLPVLFFTPETGIAGGAAALYLYRKPQEPRASSVAGDVIYTAKRQIIAELGGDLYLDQGTYRVQCDLSFKRFPNKFYGIGNNTAGSSEEAYTAQSFVAYLKLDKNVFSSFHVGPLLRVETAAMKETEPAGSLAKGSITGSRGGTAVGIGVGANWDSRDNTFASQSGSLYQIFALLYRRGLGSDYNYSDIQVDLRKFFETTPGQVLALQAAGWSVGGTVPFQNLATFGGANILRGYLEGRYRDKNAVALQAEYRIHVWWRLGLVAFGGMSQVADKIHRLALDRFWFAGGLGLRFLWSPRERVNIRMDYGIGKSSSGMYITVKEAF